MKPFILFGLLVVLIPLFGMGCHTTQSVSQASFTDQSSWVDDITFAPSNPNHDSDWSLIDLKPETFSSDGSSLHGLSADAMEILTW